MRGPDSVAVMLASLAVRRNINEYVMVLILVLMLVLMLVKQPGIYQPPESWRGGHQTHHVARQRSTHRHSTDLPPMSPRLVIPLFVPRYIAIKAMRVVGAPDKTDLGRQQELGQNYSGLVETCTHIIYLCGCCIQHIAVCHLTHIKFSVFGLNTETVCIKYPNFLD